MKTIKDKQLLMAADFAGFPLKEAIKEYLEAKGWTITDVGVKADSDPGDPELMFHRIGLRAGAMISEKEFERAMLFCGTGMGKLRKEIAVDRPAEGEEGRGQILLRRGLSRMGRPGSHMLYGPFAGSRTQDYIGRVRGGDEEAAVSEEARNQKNERQEENK